MNESQLMELNDSIHKAYSIFCLVTDIIVILFIVYACLYMLV